MLAGIITHQGNKTNGAYASVTINLPREYCLFAWLASPLYFKERLPSPWKISAKLFRIGLCTYINVLKLVWPPYISSCRNRNSMPNFRAFNWLIICFWFASSFWIENVIWKFLHHSDEKNYLDFECKNGGPHFEIFTTQKWGHPTIFEIEYWNLVQR